MTDRENDLELMAEMLREYLELPPSATIGEITAKARTIILLNKAEEAFQAARFDPAADLWTQRMERTL